MRSLLALGLTLLLGGCFDSTAVLREPRSGGVARCGSSALGLNPYSQVEGCTAARGAEGWVPEGYGR